MSNEDVGGLKDDKIKAASAKALDKKMEDPADDNRETSAEYKTDSE
jgi:hypothetical protein